MATRTRNMSPTPLAIFVRERLTELEIRQSDFCRLSMFDQGLLSKIQNSVVTSLSLESVLKLAVGLSVPPQRIFNLLDRMDMHDLVIKSYAGEFSEMVTDNLRDEAPEIADRLRAALKLLRVSGAFDLMRLAHRRHALILTYHRFSTGGGGAIGAPATLFVPADFIDRRAWLWTDKARFLTRRAVSQRLA